MEQLKSTPMIAIIEEEATPLGRYGHMRDEYLKQNHSLERTMMILHGTLDEHLQEVDRQAWERMESLMEGMMEKNPPPDKKLNFLGYVGHVNMIQAMAEEIVRNELITV